MAAKPTSPRTAKRRQKRARCDTDLSISIPKLKRPTLTTTARRREILFYGDSLTWGMSHSQATRYPLSFPQLLEERIHKLGYRMVESALCSRTTAHNDPESQTEWMPGSTSSDFNGLTHFSPLFSSHTPVILVVALGTNDLKTRIRRQSKTTAQRLVPWLVGNKTPLEEAQAIAESCAKIGEKAKELYSGFCHDDHTSLKVMVITPPCLMLNEKSEAMGYDEQSELISQHFPQAFHEMCATHGFINIGKTPPNMDESMDGVHFTRAAQSELAESVWKDIEREIEESRPATRARLLFAAQGKN